MERRRGGDSREICSQGMCDCYNFMRQVREVGAQRQIVTLINSYNEMEFITLIIPRINCNSYTCMYYHRQASIRDVRVMHASIRHASICGCCARLLYVQQTRYLVYVFMLVFGAYLDTRRRIQPPCVCEEGENVNAYHIMRTYSGHVFIMKCAV
jgi:hypothetical protein